MPTKPSRTLHFIAPSTYRATWHGSLQPSSNEPLFPLPEYQRAFEAFVEVTLEELAKKHVPLLGEIASDRADSIPTANITTPSRTTLAIPPSEAAISWTVDLREVLDFDLPAIGKRFDEAARQHADNQLDHLIRCSTAVSDAFGNVHDGEGQGLTWPVLIRALSSYPLEFDAGGNPLLPRIVDSWNRRVVTPYPPMTEADRAAYIKFIQKKRQEYDAGLHRTELHRAPD